jgi:hypothetical protein
MSPQRRAYERRAAPLLWESGEPQSKKKYLIRHCRGPAIGPAAAPWSAQSRLAYHRRTACPLAIKAQCLVIPDVACGRAGSARLLMASTTFYFD